MTPHFSSVGLLVVGLVVVGRRVRSLGANDTDGLVDIEGASVSTEQLAVFCTSITT